MRRIAYEQCVVIGRDVFEARAGECRELAPLTLGDEGDCFAYLRCEGLTSVVVAGGEAGLTVKWLATRSLVAGMPHENFFSVTLVGSSRYRSVISQRPFPAATSSGLDTIEHLKVVFGPWWKQVDLTRSRCCTVDRGTRVRHMVVPAVQSHSARSSAR